MPLQGPTRGRRSDGLGDWNKGGELHEAVMTGHLTNGHSH